MKRPELTAQQRAKLESCIKTAHAIRDEIVTADAGVSIAHQRLESVRTEHQAAAEKAKAGASDAVVDLMVIERRIGFAEQELVGAQKRRDEVRRGAAIRLADVSKDFAQVFADHCAAVKSAAELVLSELFSDPNVVSDLAGRSAPYEQATLDMTISLSCMSGRNAPEDPVEGCKLIESSLRKLIGNSVAPARG